MVAGPWHQHDGFRVVAVSASVIGTDLSQALSGKLCDRDVTSALTHAACGGG